jgi:hypothetical protein
VVFHSLQHREDQRAHQPGFICLSSYRDLRNSNYRCSLAAENIFALDVGVAPVFVLCLENMVWI